MFHYYYIDPVAISIGPLHIRWYGITYLVGFLAAWWLGHREIKRQASILTAPQYDDYLFYSVMGVIVGGRLGYVIFYQFSSLVRDPQYLFRVWEGGMSFHGGLLGIIGITWIFAKYHQLHFFAICDFIAPFVPIGLGMGRIGNFINGELWGLPTNLPWGIRVPCIHFPHQCRDLVQSATWSFPLHPSQIYEALLEGLFLFLILRIFSARPRPMMATSGLFLLTYALIRITLEFFRQPDAQLGYIAFNWITMGQVLSIPMFIAGLALLIIANYGLPQQNQGSTNCNPT
ncbi:prolipoprotein diacylglyceryl transferase [Achromatium sp. WMS2]|nr:prolipoprotein diacylglyceryl transferase [Achromatium sp. WMS2]